MLREHRQSVAPPFSRKLTGKRQDRRTLCCQEIQPTSIGGAEGNLRWKTTVSVLRCGRAVAALHKTSVGS